MVVILYLWKDLKSPVFGPDFLVGLVWIETAIASSIDIIRFYSPRHNEAVKRLPFYGKLMRPIEENHFNATTYYLLAAAILTTAYRFGWCRETTLVLSIAVLGVADPAAAWARFQLNKHWPGQEKALGLLAFLASSFLVMWAISWWLKTNFSPKCLLCIGLIVALVESYTKYWVMFVRPITRRVQNLIAHQTTVWLFQLYPDDNLVIPLTVAILAGILSQIT
jgi:dolichol kinase